MLQDGRRPLQNTFRESGSHRPAGFEPVFMTAALITGVGFMVLDVFSTVTRATTLVNSGDFLVNFGAGLMIASFCAIAQKALFSVFVNPGSKEVFDEIWQAGLGGKGVVIFLALVAIVCINFSFSSTSQVLGVSPTRLGINLPGQQYSASVKLIQWFIVGFTGTLVSFADEICFLCAKVIK